MLRAVSRENARGLSSGHAAAVAGLAVDQLTAEVVRALRALGVEPVLLKGPTFLSWLYPDGAPRSYGDTDLLVAPDQLAAARGVLAGLGFEARRDVSDLPGWSQPAQPWIRPADGGNVDLHQRLPGVRADDAASWQALTEDLETVDVGGEAVHSLGLAGRVLLVALHAATHPGGRAATEDLRRALAAVEESSWRAAVELAQRLDAIPAMAAGLAELPEGASLADQLGLPGRAAAEEARLNAALEDLARDLRSSPGIRARTRLVVRKLFPPAAFMRHWSALARRGPVGLAVAYLWRPLWLLQRAATARRSR